MDETRCLFVVPGSTVMLGALSVNVRIKTLVFAFFELSLAIGTRETSIYHLCYPAH